MADANNDEGIGLSRLRFLCRFAMSMVFVGLIGACGVPLEMGSEEPTSANQERDSAAIDFATEDIRRGKGKQIGTGDVIVVDYEGRFLDGEIFSSSYRRGRPLRPFQLGSGAVIEGWDRGLVGMRLGGIRELTIPPHLAYGDEGAGPVPPDTPLSFRVEIVKVLRR